MIDSLDAGVGALIDADITAESARLSALQTQQQLATQSLSIANQSNQLVMSLFR
jgi:flagellin